MELILLLTLILLNGVFAMSEILLQAALLKDASAPTVIEGGFKLAPWREWHARWIVAGSGRFEIRFTAEKATDREIDGVIE